MELRNKPHCILNILESGTAFICIHNKGYGSLSLNFFVIQPMSGPQPNSFTTKNTSFVGCFTG